MHIVFKKKTIVPIVALQQSGYLVGCVYSFLYIILVIISMYSAELEKLLKKKGITIGDRIKVESADFNVEGLLMPRTYKSDILVIKMDTGYNVGVDSKKAKQDFYLQVSKIDQESYGNNSKHDAGYSLEVKC